MLTKEGLLQLIAIGVLCLPLVPALAQSPGDIVINEIMQNPTAVSDANGEWFELHNTTDSPIDIDGFVIRDDGIDFHIIANGGSLEIRAGGYLILGVNADMATNGGVQVDYSYGSRWFLANGADEVVLLDGALTEIDRVSYDGGATFPDPAGASMALRDPSLDNDNGTNWCESQGPFGAGDRGTPGAANDCDVQTQVVTIPEIQGAGATSPFNGQLVQTTGIVTCDFQGPDELQGFFMQVAPPGDLDVATSDGIFVFDPGGTALNPGDVVTVFARVTEFNSLTELHKVQSIVVSGSSDVLATAVGLPEPVDGILERYEGMFVSFLSNMRVTGTFFLGRYGQLILSGRNDQNQQGRLFQPTNLFNPTLDPVDLAALVDENRRRVVVLDDGQDVSQSGDNPVPVPYLGAPPASVIRAGDRVSSVQGCIDYGRVNAGFGSGTRRDYRLHSTTPPVFTERNPRTPAPEDVSGNLRITSFNLQNYFNGNGTGGGFPTPRGADSASELERQSDKLVAAMLGLDADIVGLVELENDGFGPNSAVAELVDRLNDVQPFAWSYAIPPGTELENDGRLGTDAITVGLIYRPAAVTPILLARSLRTGAFDQNLADGGRNRVPLLHSFRLNANGEELSVVVNHFKSKGGSGSPSGGNLDLGDGQGFWNERRTEAANDLAAWLATDPTGVGNPRVLIVGDLNAYAAEDPIVALESAGYLDLLEQWVGDEAYSFVFEGQAGYLDHALATPALAALVSGATEWHINADEPAVLSYDEDFNPPGYYSPDPYRSSDHDPLLVGIDLQPDQDFDGTPDAGDCAPGDPSNWAQPGEATQLALNEQPGGTSFDFTLSLSEAGSSSDELDARVLRSGDPQDFVLAAFCIDALDPELPASGELFAYLAQALNGCPGNQGIGPLGSDSAGGPRAGSCPGDPPRASRPLGSRPRSILHRPVDKDDRR